jgi:hypothetical protein
MRRSRYATPMLEQVLELARAGRVRAESDLFDLISIPSTERIADERRTGW